MTWSNAQIKWLAYWLTCAIFSGSAAAQPKFIISNFQYPLVAPPVSFSWQLATPDGQHVDVAINGIRPVGGEIAYIITPQNAAEFGVDFPAWSLAVNDPNYSRSIVTWAGVTQEQPVVRRFPQIELDDIRIFIRDYIWPVPAPGFGPVDIRAFAFDAPVVPEPATWVLTLLSITWLSTHRCSRSPPCKSRCR